ncbi:MAG: ParA family protein [Planctomycetota bacterium]
MIGPLSSLINLLHDIYRCIPENKQLRQDLLQRQGHIDSLNDIVNSKEEKIEAISQVCVDLKGDNVKSHDEQEYAIARKEFYKGELKKAMQFIEKAKRHIVQLRQVNKSFLGQIESLAKLEGKFWESTPGPKLPLFRMRGENTAEIVAVTNLKGGVGKTTITANLAAALWKAGKRVLILDLDYQRTLTNLLLPTLELKQVELSQRYVDRLFCNSAISENAVFELAVRVGGSHQGHLISAREELADVEEHVKAHWLLNQTETDARFLLRRLLHSPKIQNEFDYILLDCPPRLTLASVNALACCDHVLIPVILDKSSTRAVTRLLRWLRILKKSGVASHLDVLGVIPNQTHFLAKYTNRERNLLNEFLSECAQVWPEPVYAFNRFIPRKPAFAKAAETKIPAAFDPAVRNVFEELVAEFEGRLAPV